MHANGHMTCSVSQYSYHRKLNFSSFCLQKLKKHREKSTGRISPPTSSTVTSDGTDGGVPGSGDKDTAAMLAQDIALAERKELVKKQKEKAMAQMQSMQRRFLERNREQMLDLEAPGVEEPYVFLLSSPPSLLTLTHSTQFSTSS